MSLLRSFNFRLSDSFCRNWLCTQFAQKNSSKMHHAVDHSQWLWLIHLIPTPLTKNQRGIQQLLEQHAITQWWAWHPQHHFVRICFQFSLKPWHERGMAFSNCRAEIAPHDVDALIQGDSPRKRCQFEGQLEDEGVQQQEVFFPDVSRQVIKPHHPWCQERHDCTWHWAVKNLASSPFFDLLLTIHLLKSLRRESKHNNWPKYYEPKCWHSTVATSDLLTISRGQVALCQMVSNCFESSIDHSVRWWWRHEFTHTAAKASQSLNGHRPNPIVSSSLEKQRQSKCADHAHCFDWSFQNFKLTEPNYTQDWLPCQSHCHLLYRQLNLSESMLRFYFHVHTERAAE